MEKSDFAKTQYIDAKYSISQMEFSTTLMNGIGTYGGGTIILHFNKVSFSAAYAISPKDVNIYWHFKTILI